jgi:predicted permease
MSRLLFILLISLGSIATGYGFRRMLQLFKVELQAILEVSRRAKITAFFFLNPVAVFSTFWGLSLPSLSILAFPALGLASIFVGAVGAVAAIRILRIPPSQAASVFTCGVFSNIVTIGGLIAYTLFREQGYALMQMYAVLMSPTYFLIGYPISNNIAKDRRRIFRIDSENLKENPYLAVPLAGIVVGVTMRVSGIQRPEVFGTLIAVLVPVVAAILGLAIGVTLQFSRIRRYLREITIVLFLRHLLVPLVMIPLGGALGYGALADGVPLKVIAILSCMPVAFNALVPPAIYGFDLDLANSAWLVSTACLMVIVPVLFLVL